jgi:hypothetical protein
VIVAGAPVGYIRGMETLDRFMESARRHARQDEEDLRESAALPTDAAEWPIVRSRLTRLADRLRASFAEFVEIDQLFQARMPFWEESPAHDAHVELAKRHASNARWAWELANGVLPDARPDPAVLADLARLKFETDELAGILTGEMQMRQGDPGTPWEEVAKKLGLSLPDSPLICASAQAR